MTHWHYTMANYMVTLPSKLILVIYQELGDDQYLIRRTITREIEICVAPSNYFHLTDIVLNYIVTVVPYGFIMISNWGSRVWYLLYATTKIKGF